MVRQNAVGGIFQFPFGNGITVGLAAYNDETSELHSHLVLMQCVQSIPNAGTFPFLSFPRAPPEPAAATLDLAVT